MTGHEATELDELDQADDDDDDQADVVELDRPREFSPAELDAAAAQLFVGLDLGRARVMARLAQAMASLDAALTESGRDPALRATIGGTIVHARNLALVALRQAVPGPNPAPPAVQVVALPLDEAAAG